MRDSSMKLLWLVLPCLLGQVSAIYNPVIEHAGATFFDRFAYYGNVDNTSWGNVTYLDQADAVSQKLTFINDVGNAIVKVDNTTTLVAGPPDAVINRNSIRLTSLDTYGLGSLIIIDAVHIPFGCSVWPSFWTFGMETTWPGAGEIDIIEAINGMDHNQVAIHTLPGCSQGQAPQTGTTTMTDCSPKQGCTVTENKPNSFGPDFATAGGGVFALQMEATQISLWFWSRPDIPASILSANSSTPMDPTTWGTPSAAYPSGASCNITEFFPPQNLVLLTTLCGEWAGVPSIYSTTCPGDCFANNVLGDGSNYADAYWEVSYIRTYINPDVPQSGSAAVVPTSSQVDATSTAAGASSSAAAQTGSTSPSGATPVSAAASWQLWSPVWFLALAGSFLLNIL